VNCWRGATGGLRSCGARTRHPWCRSRENVSSTNSGDRVGPAGVRAELAATDVAAERVHATWSRWFRERWLALGAAAIAAAAVTAHGALSYWPGRTLPGFQASSFYRTRSCRRSGFPNGRECAPRCPSMRRSSRSTTFSCRARVTSYDHAARPTVDTPVRYTFVKVGERFSPTVSTMRFAASFCWLTLRAFLVFGLLSVSGGVAHLLAGRDRGD
jgi:hypothetical protein